MNPKATQYANSKVPNPDRNDAPYYTSQDRWQDVYEAYEAGEKGQGDIIEHLENQLLGAKTLLEIEFDRVEELKKRVAELKSKLSEPKHELDIELIKQDWESRGYPRGFCVKCKAETVNILCDKCAVKELGYY